MGVLIAISMIGVAGITFLLCFLVALSREAKSSSQSAAVAEFSEPLCGTQLQIVPIALDPKRWGPAWVPSLRRTSAVPTNIDPALFAKLLHYYGEKLSCSESHSGATPNWEDVPEVEREQMTAAAALALMEVKTMMHDEESATNGIGSR